MAVRRALKWVSMTSECITAPALLHTPPRTMTPQASHRWIGLCSSAVLAHQDTRAALSVGLALILHLSVGVWLFQQALPQIEPPRPIQVTLVTSAPAEKPQTTTPAAPAPSAPSTPAPEKPLVKPAPEKQAHEKTPPKTVLSNRPKPLPAPKPVRKIETQPDVLDKPAIKSTAIERESPMPSRRMAASVAAPTRPALPAPRLEAPPGLAAASAQPTYKPPKPAYPPVALRREWTGTVKVRIKISAGGSIQSVTVDTSSGYGVLDEAAVINARKFRFVPLKPGQKRDTDTTVQIMRFRREESEDEPY